MSIRRLIIRPGAIGDVIVALPALAALEPEEIWTPSALVPVVRLAGFPNVRSIAATGLDLVGVRGGAELCPALRSFDEVVSWYGAGNHAFRDAVRPFPFRFLDALPPKDHSRNASDFFLGQVSAPRGVDPRLKMRVPRENYAVIHPFSGSFKKNWPLGHFEQLAASLPIEVRWIAGPDEQLDRATRFDDLGDLANFLAAARLYIGNDSGITHLAAAVGTLTVAIFGPTDPRVWAPRGAHVRVAMPPDRGDLDTLAPDAVLAQVQSLC